MNSKFPSLESLPDFVIQAGLSRLLSGGFRGGSNKKDIHFYGS